MIRRNYFRNILLTTAGIAFFPTKLFSQFGRRSPIVLSLLENVHIRHGYYGKEGEYNYLPSGGIRKIRIDRFLNESGDLVLWEVEMKGEVFRFGLDPEQFLLSGTHGSHHWQLNKSFRSIDLSTAIPGAKLTYLNTHMTANAFQIKSHLLLLKGSMTMNGRKNKAPCFIHATTVNEVRTDGVNALYLEV